MAIISKLDDIADAIRQKTGKTATMKLDEMPEEILSITGEMPARLYLSDLERVDEVKCAMDPPEWHDQEKDLIHTNDIKIIINGLNDTTRYPVPYGYIHLELYMDVSKQFPEASHYRHGDARLNGFDPLCRVGKKEIATGRWSYEYVGDMNYTHPFNNRVVVDIAIRYLSDVEILLENSYTNYPNHDIPYTYEGETYTEKIMYLGVTNVYLHN